MKKGNISAFLGILVVVAVVSGVITSFMLFNKQKESIKLSDNITDPVIKDDKEEASINMDEILAGVDEMYLESYLGSSHIIEINDKDLASIVDRLKSLELKLLMKADNAEENIEVYNDCLYAIHIKNKNIKIKVNEKYVMVEDVQGETHLFEGDLEQLKALNEALRAIYMEQYKTSELFENVKLICIEAKDEEKRWILNEEGAEKLLKTIHLIAPVDGKEMASTPCSYPDYVVTIETEDQKYIMHIVDEEILALDTSDNFVYYEYDKKLWDYIHENYAVAFRKDSNDFKYLLKSSKIIVDDKENLFDFEDDTYYTLEIPRWLMKSKTKEVEEIPNDEALKYSMQFIVDGEAIEVKIYENYIAYKGKNYYSEKISEIIKGALSV
ncbi:hypothetical protein [Crassaminicella indica]|uniref:Outer membrane lipoprotein-sorting protein n=1 Tax=Crassaminicella indica TaxID=2855394 RepID=A0ABX8RFI1_9CLOT|nr:hypothetical protein [Crassaminicella indica]QXM07217.1 hypothetical protein KVH43_05870 [Crassaminicella indica]